MKDWLKYRRFLIIGLGGGWRLAVDLPFYLDYFQREAELVLVDGGRYHSSQLDHEFFTLGGNKATRQAERVHRDFPNIVVTAVPKFVGTASAGRVIAVQELIRPGDVIFLQVDNYRTRSLISEYCRTLDDVTLISGGTNREEAHVMVYLRRQGVDRTPPFAGYSTKIARPTDESPADKLLRGEDCVEPLGRSTIHHPFTMLTTSTLMHNAFFTVWKLESNEELRNLPYYELWHNVARGRSRVET